ncbi:DUF692 domain-containing protein [Streptomyces endophytica]|uniref:DUF692 domain-containing protein n=1 Tax=Streptomyces endophytica TaxID=2991496 RepID=A0ABY6PGQ5_9ACTN|nr:DUF692 domain-containing protein [Streptomyces endophytica]UZJ32951.1 DUF692 domain-containing protein [Streptomyces endophytica]
MHGPPVLGVGLGYRQELRQMILESADVIDFLELITDQYIDGPPHRDAEAVDLSARFPVLLHGVDMSLGTDQAPDAEYVGKIQRLAERVHPEWISDHLCFTQVPGLNLGQLTPLAFTPETARIAARNIKSVAREFDQPFAVENISYYFRVPWSTLSEAEFLTEVVDRADCHLLLDLTNVVNNATNLEYTAEEFLDRIPLERVLQIHLAGGYWHNGVLLDTHSHPVPRDVLELLGSYAPRMPALKAVMIERDQNFPPPAELLAELAGVRGVLAPSWPTALV